MLRTPTIKNSQKPNFQTRMVFPVFFPVFNDKIVIRVWDSVTDSSTNHTQHIHPFILTHFTIEDVALGYIRCLCPGETQRE